MRITEKIKRKLTNFCIGYLKEQGYNCTVGYNRTSSTIDTVKIEDYEAMDVVYKDFLADSRFQFQDEKLPFFRRIARDRISDHIYKFTNFSSEKICKYGEIGDEFTAKIKILKKRS